MKQNLRLLLCTGLCAASLALPSLAADTEELPAQQGNFYVMVNGAYVTFPDAVPQIRESRSCLPFVTVFDQLGFPEENMTWDASTGTVTAVKPDVVYTSFGGEQTKQGDLTVELTIGSNDISYWYEGNTTADPHGQQAQVVEHIQSEIAPYISEGRTYIPFGLLADALGYQVGWDSQIGAVIIDDVDAILAANTETYERMDQFQTYNRTFVEKNQRVTGSYAVDFSVVQGESDDLLFTAKGDYDMVTGGATAFQFDTDMQMDASVQTDGVDVSDQLTAPDGTPFFPMDLGFSMRGDMDTGALYFHLDAPQLAALAGLNGDNWYKLDMKAFYDQTSAMTGMNYTQLMELSYASQEKPFSEVLPQLLKDIPLTSVEFTTTDYLKLLNTICGDSNFVQSDAGYENLFLNESGMQGTFTLYTSGEQVTGYAMELKSDPTVVGAEMGIGMSMEGSKMELAMKVDVTQGEDLSQVRVVLDMDMDGTYQATNTEPMTEPPAGAAVVDLMALFGNMMEVPSIA